MSDYLVLDAVSKAMRRILWDAFDADGVVRPIVGSESAIVFTNPTETARDSGNRLSLWLYQITENEHVKNQPPFRARVQPVLQPGENPREAFQFPPMALNLFFLVTPFAQ
ncbi:MAG TPA: Pvc16 family protein, partial [Pyrinomonadaceae bacterium]|nr:Pvc16 family protein [Pyrinomonadaceae bacterium]